MKEKLDQWHHQLHHLFGVFRKAFFQLPRIANQHLAGRRFLFQSTSPDSETLLKEKYSKSKHEATVTEQICWR